MARVQLERWFFTPAWMWRHLKESAPHPIFMSSRLCFRTSFNGPSIPWVSTSMRRETKYDYGNWKGTDMVYTEQRFNLPSHAEPNRGKCISSLLIMFSAIIKMRWFDLTTADFNFFYPRHLQGVYIDVFILCVCFCNSFSSERLIKVKILVVSTVVKQ